ncbi:MAG: molecular chaperone DnaJ [Candidatus Pacebacteria bacterium]|jgi:molecular chaperone DnaJ|nr:molecular chaperone DnaJ [Candidatus Paceibacterota bacterium]
MSKDYYQILGIDRKASADEIKKAFRKLAHKYHPDKGQGDDAKFKEISEAYSVLSNEKRRQEYDAYGRIFNESGGQGAGFGGFGFGGAQDFDQDFDIGDIFGGLGDIFGGRRQKVKRGRDISIDLEVPFRDAVFGTERKVLLTKVSQCKNCSGSGGKAGTQIDICKICNGKGKIHETKSTILGTIASVRGCENCHSIGKVPKEKCADCRGMGVLRKEEEIRITIPAGVDNGEMIRLSGGGEAISGGVPGDLYIKLHISSDPIFRKEGNNLAMNLSVKLSDALLGSSYTISTLDGNIEIKVPAGASFGEILRVRGKGVPVGKGRRGDLLVKINITLPNKLSKNAKKLVDEMKKEGI